MGLGPHAQRLLKNLGRHEAPRYTRTDASSQAGAPLLSCFPGGNVGGLPPTDYRPAVLELGIPRRARRALAAVQLALPVFAEFWCGPRRLARTGSTHHPHFQA